jgi:hypothetical protein
MAILGKKLKARQQIFHKSENFLLRELTGRSCQFSSIPSLIMGAFLKMEEDQFNSAWPCKEEENLTKIHFNENLTQPVLVSWRHVSAVIPFSRNLWRC